MRTTAATSIDDYIEGFPPEVRAKLEQIRSLIRRAAPQADEAMKYRIPTFVLGGNLVHFAAFQTHIGFYPTPSAIEEFRAELRSYQVSKGAIRFPLDRPLPLGLIRRMIAFRVKEARSGVAAKQRPKQRKRSQPIDPCGDLACSTTRPHRGRTATWLSPDRNADGVASQVSRDYGASSKRWTCLSESMGPAVASAGFPGRAQVLASH